MDSEKCEDVGASFCELPLFRGKECMTSEIMFELVGVPDGEFKNAMKLETHLEHLAPLSIEYQQLMTPLNKRFEWSDYRVSNVENTTPIRGNEIRNSLRRTSVCRSARAPFEFEFVPSDIKRMLDECIECDNQRKRGPEEGCR